MTGRVVPQDGGLEALSGCLGIGHILGVSSGQFSVTISARLLYLSLPRISALSAALEVTASDLPGPVRSGFGDHGQPPSRNWAVDPNTYTSVAAAQPVKSCWNLVPLHSAGGARIVGAEAALRAARTACPTGRHPACEPNINLTESGDLACHTPLGMTWPKPFIYKGLGHAGTLCPMTKLTPNFS